MIQMKKKGEWLTCTVGEQEAALSFGDLLRKKWAMPKKTVHLLFQHKEILVDGLPVTQVQKPKVGQTVAMRLCPPEEWGVEPIYAKLEVMYEDDHVLVVNKPAGILLHPTETENKNSQIQTLDHFVAAHFASQQLYSRIRHVHRLDRDTSGLVLYAKHAFAAARLANELEKREISRTYLAYVEGLIPEEKGKIDAPIGKDRHHASRRRVAPHGDKAVTYFEVVTRFKEATKIRCRLDTGRTHQIRVHLSHLGYPLIGDQLYGARKLSLLPDRQALHATSLTFVHPFSGERIQVNAPLPEELSALEKRLYNK
ncbi:RluA family pseudouridine synthase [Brevibacillus daliensis]|uniref:RluA family pseudouridine synthase n=1 Tax=Brevibacillus daliensis TaxID=2892995 RepID=UPI001E38DB42|nr:RluA family pseudouridine synthase [Brevibacillus daliensis]